MRILELSLMMTQLKYQEKQYQNNEHYWNEDVCKNILISKCFNDLWKHTQDDHEGIHNMIMKGNVIKDMMINSLQMHSIMMEYEEIIERKELYRSTYRFIINLIIILAHIRDKLKQVDKILTKNEDQVEQSSKLLVAQDRLDNMERQINLLTDQSEKMREQMNQRF
ncbi:unnamed protein product [Paramecium sonneborni]|uniref:Uncharacterized protein n=1 Tax=Paramecium sonneborni TaxID=65129 RepID=A0A8S1RAJ7_9CILI|nr:unnamed protein product [Paramecium sonneborni]